MSRTRHLDVEIRAYDANEPAYLGLFKNPFGPAWPLAMRYAYKFLDQARAKGTKVTFVAEGPDAKEAIRIVQEVLNTPPAVLEE